MTGSEQGTRPSRHGRRAALIGAVVAMAVPGLAGCAAAVAASPRAVPLTRAVAAGRLASGSGAGPGWVPVPFRAAQLSVPGSWLVQARDQLSCGFPRATGMIFAGIGPELPKGLGCGLTARLAWIVPAGHLSHRSRHCKPTAVIHGIGVCRLPSGKGSVRYLVPALGVKVGARGPQARRVLATLTRSPLSVALSPGRPGPVPASWLRRQFGGVWFATPRSWSPEHEHQWATCGTGQGAGTLLLIDATKPPAALPCPYQIPTASAEQAQPGLTVVTGKYAAQSVGEKYPRCLTRHGARICLSAITGQGGASSGVLIFSVRRPQHRTATYFLLGLSGSGARARTVLGSIRLGRHLA
ncbi:MAG TPA: hypothetical protein VMR14_19845 [Streptosporangiaceae bacterium]|jgi:hypothetical protein|nr:hypothetical protein [Streptosporangiaceae bacterium]